MVRQEGKENRKHSKSFLQACGMLMLCFVGCLIVGKEIGGTAVGTGSGEEWLKGRVNSEKAVVMAS